MAPAVSSPSISSLEHNLRVVDLMDAGCAQRELDRLGVAPPERERVLAQMQATTLKVENLTDELAAQLSDALQSAGGFSVSGGDAGMSLLLSGACEAFSLACGKLRERPSSAPLAEGIESTLENAERDTFRVPYDGGALDLTGRPLVMGVLNVTPDSFSDGGRFATIDRAIAQAVRMAEEGADVIDVGGESTRPGADEVPTEQELDRVLPVVRTVAESVQIPLSIDTYKAEVAEQALQAGARIVNDIAGLRGDPRMCDVLVEHGAPVVIMHMQGEPRNMQANPTYHDVLSEIALFLRQQAARALDAGVSEDAIIVDPGIGFGKTVEHNLEILRRLDELKSLGFPILIGTSRKSVIGKVLDVPVEQRLFGTLATVAWSVQQGAKIVRVHDVREAAHVITMCDAIGRA